MPIRRHLLRVLSPRTVDAIRTIRRVVDGHSAWLPSDFYQRVYENHARANDDSAAVGNGPYDLIGRLELALLLRTGLLASHTLVDFGCGTGRLTVQAIPALSQGHYIGIEISTEMLKRLEDRLSRVPRQGRVSLLHQPTDVFALADRSVDMMCAFSVFTHMEHEDTFRYLRDARRIVKSGGRFVFSCLTLDTVHGQRVFLESASVDVQVRWGRVRNVGTSRELMQDIARLAGWKTVEWHGGDEPFIALAGEETLHAFGQSVGILE